VVAEAVEMMGGEYGGRRPRCRGREQGGSSHCLKGSVRSGRGGPVVQTERLTEGPRWFLYYP
jgi:hypothetical protein